jgi:hypothetical protein
MAKIRTQKNRYERRKALRETARRVNKIIDYFYNTATSIFSYEFEGVSKMTNNLMSREVEHLLFNHGWATIFRDKDGIVKIGKVVGFGKLGIYRQFVEWSAVLANGQTVHGLNETNAVIIYNNKSRLSTRYMIEDDIRNMIDVDTSIIQHIKAVRVPFVFSGNEEDMLTFKSMWESVVDGEGAFFLDSESKTGQGEPFRVFNSDVDYKGDKLMMLYEAFENRVFTLLGIQSNRIDKKAQVGETEVNKNDDVILINFEAFNSERQSAIESLKEIGINVKLNINKFLIKQRDEDKQKSQSEGKKDNE